MACNANVNVMLQLFVIMHQIANLSCDTRGLADLVLVCNSCWIAMLDVRQRPVAVKHQKELLDRPNTFLILFALPLAMAPTSSHLELRSKKRMFINPLVPCQHHGVRRSEIVVFFQIALDNVLQGDL